MGWNAWQAADLAHHIAVRLCPLPPETGGGAHAAYPDGHVVLIDDQLDGPDRHDTLAHELVHVERGALPQPIPRRLEHLVAREERCCWDIVADRVIPPAVLAAWCDRQTALGHAVGVNEVVDEFGVSRRVAEVALENLRRRREGRG